MKKLEREGSLWIDDRFQALNATIKNLQDKVHMSESLFDEIVGKRRASLHYAIMNDITLKKVLTMMDANDAGWKLIKSEDGYEAYGVIRAPPKKVLELFEDNTRVREYNTLFEKGRDIEVVGENTKVVWAASSPIFPFKPRDFCTVVHIRQLKDGTFVVLNRATKHPDVPVLPNYVRGSIVLGANIIQPIPGKSNMCRLTMITQVDPVMLVGSDRILAKYPISSFIQAIEEGAGGEQNLVLFYSVGLHDLTHVDMILPLIGEEKTKRSSAEIENSSATPIGC
eukprot:scaffold424_cov165-Ochromonas_danica.AAC.25